VVARELPGAACQVRTPAGAAVHDRGDRQGPRSGHPPSPVRAGHVPETVKPYLIAIKRAGPGAAAPRFCRHDGTSCRQEPAQPSIAPTANPCWEPVFGIRVRAGTGETSGTPHILPAQRPTGGTARMWRSPAHRSFAVTAEPRRLAWRERCPAAATTSTGGAGRSRAHHDRDGQPAGKSGPLHSQHAPLYRACAARPGGHASRPPPAARSHAVNAASITRRRVDPARWLRDLSRTPLYV
jgi:hypothetical protein